MKIQQFLEHHGISTNPFADEDAQSDLVFKSGCIRATYHPTWDKIYGDPSEPATAVVFGEKGSGKTAIGLQIVRHLADYNVDHPQAQAFVVRYDDFNPFLDRFRERFSGRRRRNTEKLLEQWRLWDHMDAVLAMATTQMVDRLLGVKQSRHPAAREGGVEPAELDAAQRRDCMLLAACYDQSTGEDHLTRWRKLAGRLGFSTWRTWWTVVVGILVTAATIGIVAWFQLWPWLLTPWPYLAIAAGWVPWAWRWLTTHLRAWKIVGNTRVLNHSVHMLRKILLSFPGRELVGQPLPNQQRSDDRYELLTKLQGVLRSLRFEGVIVLVDRVDEPYLINGSTELMRLLVWPILDNKFLKHPGLGLKLLLPIELERLIDREPRDFHQRARLDKQHLVRSLQWTGQALYDVANARVKACSRQDGGEGGSPSSEFTDLFESSVDQQRLINSLASLRVPRNLFKFMYRVLTTHCNAHTDDAPAWQISAETFESTLALYQRDQDAFDRGVGAG